MSFFSLIWWLLMNGIIVILNKTVSNFWKCLNKLDKQVQGVQWAWVSRNFFSQSIGLITWAWVSCPTCFVGVILFRVWLTILIIDKVLLSLIIQIMKFDDLLNVVSFSLFLEKVFWLKVVNFNNLSNLSRPLEIL